MSPHPTDKSPAPASAWTRFIDGFNPGITLLVLVWVVGMGARDYLELRGTLTDTIYKLLTSLIYVVPIMLVGWGVLAICDRMFGLGLFRNED